MTYYNVEFTDDFGEFKKGDKFHAIDVHYGEGIVCFYNEDGDITRKTNFVAKPI